VEMLNDVKISDYWWIDLPVFMTIFLLTIVSMLVLVIDVERSLGSMTTTYPHLDVWIAPFVEETFKFLGLIFGISFGIVYTIIFAVAELLNFINWGIRTGNDIPAFYIMRAIAVCVHLITLSFQIFGFKMYYKYNYKIYLAFGYITAVFFHYEWNTIFGKFLYFNVVDWYSNLSQYLGL